MTKMKHTVLRSGQPRPYANTEYVVLCEFDQPLSETEVRVFFLQHTKIGFTNTPRIGRKDHFDTYLDYLRPINLIDGKADRWEFRTVSPYTD